MRQEESYYSLCSFDLPWLSVRKDAPFKNFGARSARRPRGHSAREARIARCSKGASAQQVATSSGNVRHLGDLNQWCRTRLATPTKAHESSWRAWFAGTPAQIFEVQGEIE